ncbi:MAG: CHAT domain-containing protein [Phycisphaerae bacterium]|nr:CHAT domain-containing protein [Phycisphaerae bacterium]
MSDARTLEAWISLDASERVEWLARQPDSDAALLAFGDDCERLASSHVRIAIDTGRALLAFSAHDGRARPRLLRALATSLAYGGDMDESLATAEEAVRVASNAGLGVEAARATLGTLHPLTHLGRTEEALARGERARDELTSLGEPKLAARADINLANIRKAVGDAHAALVHLARARSALGDEPAMLAHVENALGEAHWLRDDFVGARRAFEASATHFRATGQAFAGAIVEGNLADLASREGRLQDALGHFEAARGVLEQDAARSHLARITAEEAEVLEAFGAPQEALRALDSALSWLTPVGFPAESLRARLARARVLASLGRFTEADEDARAAAAGAATRGDATLARRATLLAAELALLRGDAPSSIALASGVAAIESSPPLDRIIAKHHLGRATAVLGDLLAAHATLDGAISECRELGVDALLADLLLARAATTDDRTERVGLLVEAVALVERLRSTIRAERLRANWTGSRSRAYEALALAQLALVSPASLDAAFDAVERSKSRTLLDLVQRAADRVSLQRSSSPDDGGLSGEFDRLRARLSALYSRWESEGTPGERRSVIPAALVREEIRADERQLDEIARRIAARRGPSSLMARPSPVADIRSQLGAQDRIIEYFVADGEVMAFVVGRDQIMVRRQLGTAAEVALLTVQILFQMRCATMHAEQSTALAQERMLAAVAIPARRLYDILLRPLTDLLDDASTLAIIPHGVMHGIPFHALIDADTGLYAVELWNIRTAPSATLAVARSSNQRRGFNRVLVVGAADASAPSITTEAHAIEAQWPTATGLIGARATADAVLGAMPQHNLIHLACHGRFAETLPHASGLRFSDRWASVREVIELPLSADLVILAGCETGRAVLEPGEEAVGLPRAFLAAGAASVIVSLWPVRDVDATEFMIALHRRIASRPRGALTSLVRETMLERVNSNSHPAFWGAFGLVGADPWATIDDETPLEGALQ